MIVTMTAMLVSAVDLSNIFSVFLVLVCFCGMVLFIMSRLRKIMNIMVFRLHGDDIVFGGPIRPLKPHIPQMKMMKVHIPFTFKLQETSKSSYAETLRPLKLVYGSTQCFLFDESRRIKTLVTSFTSMNQGGEWPNGLVNDLLMTRISGLETCLGLLRRNFPLSHHIPPTPTPLTEKVGTLLIPSTYTSVLPTVYCAVTAQSALRRSLSNKNTTEVCTSGSRASSAFHTNSYLVIF
uniref:Uncharacterized protein n=1 Tax=Timema tahoe TaxID=61484 RepID=A0A7R9IS38_9NEOP|nr:unnamed protein product [Timema tahoe]